MAGGYSSESARRALPPAVYSELGEERGEPREPREVAREGRLFRIKFSSLALVTVRYLLIVLLRATTCLCL